MDWSSTQDIEHKQTTWIYNLPSADFKAIYDMLKTFSTEHNLEDAVLAVRKYDDKERRENGISIKEMEFDALSDADKKKKKRPKSKPVDANDGICWVESFEWKIRELDDLKYIEYLFYDEGWPGRCIVSKKDSASTPTEIVFTCCDRATELGSAFKELLEKTNIPPEPAYALKSK